VNATIQPADLVDLARERTLSLGVVVTITIPSADVDVVTGVVQGAGTIKTVLVTRPALVPREAVDGTTITADTLEAFLSSEGEVSGLSLVALTFTPAFGQTLTWGSTAYRVVEVSEGGAAGSPVGYRLRFRS
jgi:hypothetical protein